MFRTHPNSAESAGPSVLQNTAAALAVVVAAGLTADLVLWPRDQLPPVAPVSQNSYFTQAFIDRAAAFRGPQSWLALAAATTLIVVPLLIALFWPRPREGARLARWSDRRNRVLFGHGGAPTDALVGGGVTLIALVAAMPFQFAGFMRARDFGLSVQSIHGWLWSWTGSTALMVLAAALLAILAGFLIRRLRKAWWVAFGVCLIALAIVFQALSPVLIEPLFADFSKVPAGQLRGEVDEIAKRSGVHAGDVYLVDAASRTTGANAYVAGLGSTKRVVIYDTQLKDFTPAERRQVIAHEFGHARHRDLIAGLIWFSFVALVALFAVDVLARTLASRRDVELASPAGLAMVLAAAMLAIAISQPAGNAWSRAIEARADAFALRVTQQPDTAIALERRLTIKNLARPEPPAVRQFLFGTHPTTMQRIGMAVTVKRELAAGKVETLP
jgi:STE24 endopeptidase